LRAGAEGLLGEFEKSSYAHAEALRSWHNGTSSEEAYDDPLPYASAIMSSTVLQERGYA